MLKVYPLKNYPKYISEINKIVFDEFKYFFPNLSMEDFEKSVNEKLNIDKLPIFYVAFDDNKLIGCFALRGYDIKVSKDFSPPLKEKYSPWLGSIVVYPHYRGQGYGKALVEIAKQKIKELGFKKLYLFTDKEKFYIRLRFKIIQKTKINNNPCSIMSCSL